ncbi:MAG TPA: TMEM175 family protein [Rhizomicrobium sp.]
MDTNRLLAMTDGVIAIIITIMVLELKVPEGATLEALMHAWPIFLAYALSFIYVAIYWNNHHHYFHLVRRVNAPIMWGNFNLLFWLSLVPFATNWMGEHPFTPVPTAFYGVALVLPALAWRLLQAMIIRSQGDSSPIKALVGRDAKATLSPAIYAVGIALAFVAPWASLLCYAVVAATWFIPDRRIERIVAGD